MLRSRTFSKRNTLRPIDSGSLNIIRAIQAREYIYRDVGTYFKRSLGICGGAEAIRHCHRRVFQLVQALLADSHAELFSGTAMTLDAARKYDNDEDILMQAA